MRVRYPDLISESASDLARAAMAHRGTPLASRVQMLRLLNDGTVASQGAVAAVLGYSERHVRRWWSDYRTGGLEALLQRGTPGGSAERVSPEAWAGLTQKLRAGEIARLEDARRYLADEHGIAYAGITAISALFQRHKVKLKTGRPRHVQTASEAARAAFKK